MPINYAELGLDEAQTKAVEKAVKEAIAKEYIPLERFNEVNKDLKQAKTDIGTRDKQLKNLGTSATDAETLKAELQKIKDDNAAAAKKYAEDIAEIKRSNAIDRALEGAKARIPKAVKALLDLDKIKLDGETLIGMDDQLKTLMEDESSKILFGSEAATEIKGAKPAESGNADLGSGEVSPGAMYAQQFNAMYAPPTTK